jgi:PAS domain S-box-containing protein
MNDKDKTREQLTIELRELQQKYDSLKEISDKGITKHKQAEKFLLESNENLSITLHSIGDGVISTDKNGLIVQMNPIAEKLCGWKLYDAAGKPLTEVFKIINAETRESVADPVRKVLENSEIVGLANHTVLISKNGNEYQISDSAAPIKTKEGEITGVVLVFSDVTESYAAQKQMNISEERYRSLLNNLEAGIVVHAPDTSIVMNNPRASELLGLTNDQMRGKAAIDPVWKFVNEDNIPIALEDYPVNRIVSTKQAIKNQILGIHQPGKNNIVWVTVNGFPALNKTGEITEIVISSIDITERKKKEEKVREKNIQFRKLSANVSDLIFQFTRRPDGTYYVPIASEGIRNIFGCSPEDVLNDFTPIGKVIYPDDAVRVISDIEYSAKHLTYFTCEFRVQIPGKAIQWIYSKSNPEKLPDGSITWYGFNADITERKQAEESLIKLKTAIEKSEVSVIITDSKGNIEYANPFFTELTGYSVDEYIGQNPKVLKTDYHPKEFYEELWNTIVSGKTWEGEFYNRKKNGEFYWENAIISPIKNDKNEITHFVAIKTDITEAKKTSTELIIAKDKAEESNRLKSAFLANMSHEIRTPMNGILGFAGLLKEPNLTGKEQQKYIQIIEKGGARMLNIINDIINISKIESGQMDVTISDSNINEQIEYIYTFFKPEIEAKGMQLSFKNMLPVKEATIKTDREKLFAILTNLVKNAIKYSEKGSIEIGYDKKGEHLEFYVKDSGIGIESNRKEAIFERFIQADIEDKMARQGAGLGLSISKAYVELLGGKLWVESEKGIGSIFYFTIPYTTELLKTDGITNSTADDVMEAQVKNLKILIVEDDETSDLLLSTMLTKINREILQAKNGLEAIELCRNNPDLDLILMDIKMPVMDGYEATRQIRQFNKDVIIIAQTAYGLTGDRENAIVAGCNAYISKPIIKDELMSLIQQYFIK